MMARAFAGGTTLISRRSVSRNKRIHSFLAAVFILLVPALRVAATPLSLDAKLGKAGDFVLLGLNNGTMIINSATSITGNVGYSSGVVSTTNQKIDTFTGTVYVHSGATFNYTPATYQPTGGIIQGGAANTALNQANTDATNAALCFVGTCGGLLPLAVSLGNVTTDLNLTMPTGSDIAIFDAATWDYNSNKLTLHGDANDLFVFRVAGAFDWSQSQTLLDGISPAQVLFYFPNASTIDVNKSATQFIGTIFAPTGSVTYHNPATFDGRIIAENINVHSDFNISAATGPSFASPARSVREPMSLLLLGSGLLILVALRRVRRGEGFAGLFAWFTHRKARSYEQIVATTPSIRPYRSAAIAPRFWIRERIGWSNHQ